MTFLSLLHNFNPQRLELLENRKKQQALFDAGALPTLLKLNRESVNCSEPFLLIY
jgi:malate synthase